MMPSRQSTDSPRFGFARDSLVMAVGLVLGIAAGGVFLLADRDKPTDESPRVAVETPSGTPSKTEPVTSTNRTALPPQSDELAAKVKALEAEVENQKLLRRIEALQQQLQSKPVTRVAQATTRPTAATSRQSQPSRTVRSASRPSVPSTSPGKATLAYWNGMNDAIETELNMRKPPIGGVTDDNAGDFLARRIDAYEFACNTIRALPRATVDGTVVELAMAIADWYEEGIEVCSRGKALLDHGSAKDRKGAPGKQWQAAEKKHNRDVNALNQRGAGIRDAMKRKYKLTFPPLK